MRNTTPATLIHTNNPNKFTGKRQGYLSSRISFSEPTCESNACHGCFCGSGTSPLRPVLSSSFGKTFTRNPKKAHNQVTIPQLTTRGRIIKTERNSWRDSTTWSLKEMVLSRSRHSSNQTLWTAWELTTKLVEKFSVERSVSIWSRDCKSQLREPQSSKREFTAQANPPEDRLPKEEASRLARDL